MVGPLVGADEDPGMPTTNVKNIDSGPPWEVPKLEIRKRPPSTLRNVNDRPLGVARAGDPGSLAINARKHR
jgi:hypothetical protein